MKILKDILYKVHLREVIGSTSESINSLHIDSRQVEIKSLFIAVKGTLTDGHNYISTAIEKGAKAIVCETFPQEIVEEVVYLKVENSSQAVAQIAANFYDNPSTKLKLVAITGTNGKTSVATLLYKLYSKLGYLVGLVSTVENKIGENIIPATHTTPDAISLNKLLLEMVNAGCEYCFMEASSHAIHQNRTFALDFDGAVFTNLSHDHLDYHETFAAYLKAKKMLFDNLPSSAFALTNLDDRNGTVMLQNTKAKQKSYALKSMSDFSAKILESDFTGMALSINNIEIHTLLVGNFNAYNFLAVYAVSQLLETDKAEVLTVLSALQGAEGRFDYTVSPNDKIVGIVDYAHTPDALKKVVETINQVKKPTEKLLTIVGCGGDRDKTKRPIMANIAAKNSDVAILTSDNPRTENPSKILEEMRLGVEVVYKKKILVIENRSEAIRTAITMATKNDVILVAGKGHEKYQDINGVKQPFDDKVELLNAFKEMEK